MRIHDYELLPSYKEGFVTLRWNARDGKSYDVPLCMDDLELCLGGMHGILMRNGNLEPDKSAEPPV